MFVGYIDRRLSLYLLFLVFFIYVFIIGENRHSKHQKICICRHCALVNELVRFSRGMRRRSGMLYSKHYAYPEWLHTKGGCFGC